MRLAYIQVGSADASPKPSARPNRQSGQTEIKGSDGAAPSNIDAVIAAYGSYMPAERLLDGIVYIVNNPPADGE